MELTISHETGYTLATVTGPIDKDAGGPLDEHLTPLLAQRGAHILLDLSKAEQMSSLGLAHLVRLAAHANTNGSRIILVAPTPFISSVLSVTKLSTFFEIAENLSEALSDVETG